MSEPRALPDRPARALYRAVIFDLGGVVLGSPLHAIAAYERERGIPDDFINRHVVASAPDGAWHRLERGEVELGDEFFQIFDDELERAGQTIESRIMMARVAEISKPRPQMIAAIAQLRELGLQVAALTNNWNSSGDGEGKAEEAKGNSFKSRDLKKHFDHFVESSIVGLRKPDPAIYHHTLSLLGVDAPEAIFLDDIGSNLKSARALGMTTIKVDDPDQALDEMWRALGLEP